MTGTHAGDLGAALRTLRKAAGLTLSDVSGSAGVSAPYLSNVENGNARPSADWVRNVVESIGAAIAIGRDAA